MEGKWVVTVKVGYDDIDFVFDDPDKAVEFAKLAFAAAVCDVDSRGEKEVCKVKINSEMIKEDN